MAIRVIATLTSPSPERWARSIVSPDEVGIQDGLPGAALYEELFVLGQFRAEPGARVPRDEMPNDACHTERRKGHAALGAVEAVVGADGVVSEHRASLRR